IIDVWIGNTQGEMKAALRILEVNHVRAFRRAAIAFLLLVAARLAARRHVVDFDRRAVAQQRHPTRRLVDHNRGGAIRRWYHRRDTAPELQQIPTDQSQSTEQCSDAHCQDRTPSRHHPSARNGRISKASIAASTVRLPPSTAATAAEIGMSTPFCL